MLYSDGTALTRDLVNRAFPTVRPLRDLLLAHGFTPLTTLGNGEHWVRRGRRIVLVYDAKKFDDNGFPVLLCDDPPADLIYATPVLIGVTDWTLSLD